MIGLIVFWTGAAAWAWIIFCLLLLLVAVAKSAFTSARFVCRLYSNGGWYRGRDGSLRLTYPLKLWWAGFLNSPFISITRHDNGVTVYWPGREHLDD